MITKIALSTHTPNKNIDERKTKKEQKREAEKFKFRMEKDRTANSNCEVERKAMNRYGFTKLKNVYCILSLRRKPKKDGERERNGKGKAEILYHRMCLYEGKLEFQIHLECIIMHSKGNARAAMTKGQQQIIQIDLDLDLTFSIKHIIHKRCITISFIWLALKSSAINIDTDKKRNIKISSRA